MAWRAGILLSCRVSRLIESGRMHPAQARAGLQGDGNLEAICKTGLELLARNAQNPHIFSLVVPVFHTHHLSLFYFIVNNTFKMRGVFRGPYGISIYVFLNAP